MKPATLLLITVNFLGLTSAAAIPEPAEDDVHSLGKRACFQSGATFGSEKDDAEAAVRNVCSGRFTGTYNRGTIRKACFNLPNGKSVKLELGLRGPNAGSTRSIYSEECYSGLGKEIYNCGRGGATTYGNWYYRVDPNLGSC